MDYSKRKADTSLQFYFDSVAHKNFKQRSEGSLLSYLEVHFWSHKNRHNCKRLLTNSL